MWHPAVVAAAARRQRVQSRRCAGTCLPGTTCFSFIASKTPLARTQSAENRCLLCFPIPLEMAAFSCPGKGQSWAGLGECGGRRMGANSRRTWVRHTAEGRAPACSRSRHPNKNAPQRLPFFPCGENWSQEASCGVVIDCRQRPALALLPRRMPACGPAAPVPATAAALPTPDAAPCCEVLAPSATRS